MKITDLTLSEINFHIMEAEEKIRKELQAKVHEILDKTGLLVTAVNVTINNYVDDQGEHYPTVFDVNFIIDFKNPVQ